MATDMGNFQKTNNINWPIVWKRDAERDYKGIHDRFLRDHVIQNSRDEEVCRVGCSCRTMAFNFSIWFQIDRLQLTAVCRDRQVCKNNFTRPVSVMWTMEEFGIQIEWTMTGKIGLQHVEEKNFVVGIACVVKWSWPFKPSCWTVRRPTPMTKWKPKIQRNINTKHMKPNNDEAHLGNTWMCA